MIRARYVATIFAGAMLLFLVQPMAARMFVPLLGGAPAVWIVCSLCFQALLLAGYAYAHVLGSRLSVRAQIVVHLAVVATGLLAFPIAVDAARLKDLLADHPTAGLILVVLRTVGAPFFVLSTTSPLVQRWFAHRGERDPYHLYAASNAGSMLTLVGYPFVIEPALGLTLQTKVFQAGYVVFAALVALSAFTTVRGAGRAKAPEPPPASRDDGEGDGEPSREVGASALLPAKPWAQRLLWIALAFVPSTLLLGTTEVITTDIASVPLLWLLPLALYLVSFIVAFAAKPPIRLETSTRLAAVLAPTILAMSFLGLNKPVFLVTPVHLGFLLVAAILCHQTLASLRPGVERLTEFYLLLSVGGALGGVWNGIVAPLVFPRHEEYLLAAVLVLFARRWAMPPDPDEDEARERRRDLVVGAAVVALAIVVFRVVVPTSFFVQRLAFVVLLLACFTRRLRPRSYAWLVVALHVGAGTHAPDRWPTLWAGRSFFGSLKVVERDGFRVFSHGTTVHGAQSNDPEAHRSPSSYYHRTGPAGDVLGPIADEPPPGEAARRIGLIGLGAGELASYARRGDAWTFFELDPDVVMVARKYFTFLSDAEARGVVVEVETGDARLRVAEGAADRFDVLVLDAFSSDAIPVHLLTREALAVYRRSLAPNGLLLAHLSNQHLFLPPVLATLASDAGWQTACRGDPATGFHEVEKQSSLWCVVAAPDEIERRLPRLGAEWRKLDRPPKQAVWTDDYANLLSALVF